MNTIQSIRVNSNIRDEQLWEFFGSWPIVDIVRGSWMSHVTFFPMRRRREMIKANFLWKPKSRIGIKLVAGYNVLLFVAFVIRLMTLGDFAGRAPLVLLSFPWILLPGLWFSTSPNSMIEHYPREMMAFWALSVILNITFLYFVGYIFDRIRAYFVKPR